MVQEHIYERLVFENAGLTVQYLNVKLKYYF